MDLFGVFGKPILHSLSPAMHNAAFEAAGVDARYVRVAADDAESVLRAAASLRLKGFNVTAPFKEDVARLADEREEIADRLGSANTLVRAAKKWRAHTTDPAGVSGALEAHEVGLQGERALVIGAGGAGRAAAFALRQGGATVTIANRTLARARAAARLVGCEACSLEEAQQLARASRVIIGTASTDERILDPDSFAPGTVVMDARYQSKSALSRDAHKAGCAVLDGREWLLHQAAAAFRIFTGSEAPIDVMSKALKGAKPKRGSHLALIGFMGVGKTTLARTLAKRLGTTALDTDALVAQRARMDVPSLLRDQGEPALRRWERKVVSGLDGFASVLACGGGLVTQKAAARALRSKARLVVWLWAKPETCLQRIVDLSSRPLLQGSPLSIAERLLNRRMLDYAAACDVVVDTEGRTVSEVATQVAELWKELQP